jgi:hypothetical protein
MVLCTFIEVRAADAYISGKAAINVTSDSATTIGGFTIGDPDNPASLSVEVSSTSGTLNLVTTTGITGTTTGTALSFSGSIAHLNTAINSMTYQRNPTFNNAADNLTLRVSDDGGTTWYPYTVNITGKFYYPLNGHYYEFVAAGGISWDAANTAASARTLYGLGGYLATITSAAENSFIYPKLGGNGWIGASDEASEGIWKWVTGPEAGTQFWLDSTTAGTSSESFQGATVGGNYANWDAGEPNNSYSSFGEDHAHMYGTDGTWNDYFKGYTSAISGYVVEYGGSGFGTLSAAQLAVDVAIANNAPVASNGSSSTAEDTAKEITLSATDADGNTLTYSIVANPSNGTLGPIVGNKVTYTPAANYNGSDSFTFRANDGSANSNTGTVTLSITAVNDAPSFSLTKTTREDNVATFTLAEFTGGFVDVDNDALGTVTIKSLPVNGVLSLGSAPVTVNQVIAAADLANLKYTPVADDFGAKPV